MTLAARIYGEYPAYRRFAGQALQMAERAYAWAVRNPHEYYNQDAMNEKYEPKVFTGAYGDGNANDEFFWAATELYLATGQNAYLEQAKQFAPKDYSVPTWGNVAGLGVQQWLNHSILNKVEDLGIDVQKMKSDLLAYLLIPLSSRQSNAGFPLGKQQRDVRRTGHSSPLCLYSDS